MTIATSTADADGLEFYEYSAVQRRLRAFGASIAGHRRFPMDIIPDAGGCWTDFNNRRVTIDPNFVPFRSAEEGMVLCKGYTAHEYAHVNYTTPLQNFRDTKPNVETKVLAHVINILDDERIERAQSESHWGTEKYLKYLRYRMYQNTPLLRGDDDPRDVLAAILQVRFGGMPKGILSPANAVLFSACWPHVETAWTAANTMEVAVEAEAIMKILGLDKMAAEQQKQMDELEKELREILKGMACGSIMMGPARSDSADQSPGKGGTVIIVMPAGAGDGSGQGDSSQPDSGQAGGQSSSGGKSDKSDDSDSTGSAAGSDGAGEQSGKSGANGSDDSATDADDKPGSADAGAKADSGSDNDPAGTDKATGSDAEADGDQADDADANADGGGQADADKTDAADADASGGDKANANAAADADSKGSDADGEQSGDNADGSGDNPLQKADTIIVTIEQIKDILGQEAEVLTKTLGKPAKPAGDKPGTRKQGAAGGWQDQVSPLRAASAEDIITAATARAEILSRRLRQLPPRKRTQAVTFGPRYSMRDEWNRPDKPFRKRDLETKKRTVAISMLVDCSGSMGGLMPGVREAVLSTYLASQDLNVPVEVRAFSSWHSDPAPVIVSFDDSPNTAPERIAGLSATGGTMLELPLRIAGSELAKRREQHKVLLVIHDGQPGDAEESRLAILQLKRKMTVIGVYLGNSSERVTSDLRELFGKHLVVAENTEQLMTLLGAFIIKMVAPYG